MGDHFRTLFEDTVPICQAKKDHWKKTTVLYIIKGMTIANQHIEGHSSFFPEIRELEDIALDHPLSNIYIHQ